MDYKSGKLLIEQKVEDFNKNENIYLNKSFQETETRNRFIDPLFMALGWEFDQTGIQRRHWDVHREFSQRDNSSTKKPDYAFRADGKVKFFVEAKAPWVPLTEKGPIFQAKRYAFSTAGKTPIVILTDFQEFRVFNTLARPIYDNPLQGLLKGFDLKYTEFPEKWDFLYGNFSKEAVLAGSIEKLAGKISKNTKSLDAEFLADITEWRENLAKNIAIRNKALSVDEINEAVQRILDRLIFIRNLEDRCIEEEGQLTRMIENKDDEAVYGSLIPMFQRLDSAYNGLLFKKHFSEDLEIDGKTIKAIVKNLCWPASPFQFDIIEPEILGRIYEKFLGSKIRLTEEHRAKVEEKPEVRKAGGVYYTPEYIVRYIVENTVGETTKGKTPEQIEKIKILDPACGSGSFLIGALGYLIEHHRQFYVDHRGEKKYKGDWYETPEGEVCLTIQKKRDILKNNIFGVDIDREATEVAIMSLYLKLLEEGFDKGEAQLFVGTLLPDMTANIKCGNSLISSDYYEGRDLKLFSDEEFKNVNVFDWDGKNGFPEIMKAGRFDCVIGNPPYVRMEGFKEIKDYLKNNYSCHDERSDLYAYFIEKGHRLLNSNGRFGMIVSNKFFRSNYGKPLRDAIIKIADVERIVDFAGLPVFKGATVRTVIIITSQKKNDNKLVLYAHPVDPNVFSQIENGITAVEDAVNFTEVDSMSLGNDSWNFVHRSTEALLNHIKNKNMPLGEHVDGNICMGIKSGLTEAFIIDNETKEKLVKMNPESAEIIKPFIVGRNIKSYSIDFQNAFIIYTYHGIKMDKYPAALEYLSEFKDKLKNRATKQEWYELQQPQYNYYEYFEKPKIVFPDIAKETRFAIDNNGLFCANTVYFLPVVNKYLLGLLNSSLANYYFNHVCAGLEGKNEKYLRFFGQYLENFPVHVVEESNVDNLEKKNRIIEIVNQIENNINNKDKGQGDHEKILHSNKIKILSHQIDALVYELYGLTEEEIKIIEGGQT